MQEATMEAPHVSKDEWKLSAQAALLVFLFAVLTVMGLCASVSLKKKRIKHEQHEKQTGGVVSATSDDGLVGKQSVSGWDAIKKALVGSVRWSGASKWGESERRNLQGTEEMVVGSGWDAGGRTIMSPLWQRRILMGEKCELPRYSGLILYDERGLPLHGSSNNDTPHQEKSATVVATLKDLL